MTVLTTPRSSPPFFSTSMKLSTLSSSNRFLTLTLTLYQFVDRIFPSIQSGWMQCKEYVFYQSMLLSLKELWKAFVRSAFTSNEQIQTHTHTYEHIYTVAMLMHYVGSSKKHTQQCSHHQPGLCLSQKTLLIWDGCCPTTTTLLLVLPLLCTK